jgi:hypothetical protein
MEGAEKEQTAIIPSYPYHGLKRSGFNHAKHQHRHFSGNRRQTRDILENYLNSAYLVG